MGDIYPSPAVTAGHVEPSPRRVRGVVDNATAFDTRSANYVWEWPFYPQYYIPVADVSNGVLVDEDHEQRLRFGTARRHGVRSGERIMAGVAQVYGDDAPPGIAGRVRFDWAALDAWFEEDEQIFVHPRSPYVRVDAIRSKAEVVVELDGVRLARSTSPVMVFETGLPTRYYVNKTDVDFQHLIPTHTQTPCPYKGVTTGYWSAHIGQNVLADVAWTYGYPASQVSPIAGLVAFYNELVDIRLDGVVLERPETHHVKRR